MGFASALHASSSRAIRHDRKCGVDVSMASPPLYAGLVDIVRARLRMHCKTMAKTRLMKPCFASILLDRTIG